MRISDWSSDVCSSDLPRDEQDRPDPISDYGWWKAKAEALVAEEAPAAAIVRLPLIISLDPEDHIVGAIRAGVRNRERSVWFHDELRQPALASELAEAVWRIRSEEHTSELKSLMRISYAVFCLKKKNTHKVQIITYGN